MSAEEDSEEKMDVDSVPKNFAEQQREAEARAQAAWAAEGVDVPSGIKVDPSSVAPLSNLSPSCRTSMSGRIMPGRPPQLIAHLDNGHRKTYLLQPTMWPHLEANGIHVNLVLTGVQKSGEGADVSDSPQPRSPFGSIDSTRVDGDKSWSPGMSGSSADLGELPIEDISSTAAAQAAFPDYSPADQKTMAEASSVFLSGIPMPLAPFTPSSSSVPLESITGGTSLMRFPSGPLPPKPPTPPPFLLRRAQWQSGVLVASSPLGVSAATMAPTSAPITTPTATPTTTPAKVNAVATGEALPLPPPRPALITPFPFVYPPATQVTCVEHTYGPPTTLSQSVAQLPASTAVVTSVAQLAPREPFPPGKPPPKFEKKDPVQLYDSGFWYAGNVTSSKYNETEEKWQYQVKFVDIKGYNKEYQMEDKLRPAATQQAAPSRSRKPTIKQIRKVQPKPGRAYAYWVTFGRDGTKIGVLVENDPFNQKMEAIGADKVRYSFDYSQLQDIGPKSEYADMVEALAKETEGEPTEDACVDVVGGVTDDELEVVLADSDDDAPDKRPTAKQAGVSKAAPKGRAGRKAAVSSEADVSEGGSADSEAKDQRAKRRGRPPPPSEQQASKKTKKQQADEDTAASVKVAKTVDYSRQKEQENVDEMLRSLSAKTKPTPAVYVNKPPPIIPVASGCTPPGTPELFKQAADPRLTHPTSSVIEGVAAAPTTTANGGTTTSAKPSLTQTLAQSEQAVFLDGPQAHVQAIAHAVTTLLEPTLQARIDQLLTNVDHRIKVFVGGSAFKGQLESFVGQLREELRTVVQDQKNDVRSFCTELCQRVATDLRGHLLAAQAEAEQRTMATLQAWLSEQVNALLPKPPPNASDAYQAEAQRQVQRQAQLEADTEAEAQRQARLKADTEAEAQRQAQVKADTEAEAQRQAQVKADNEAEAQRQAQRQAQLKAANEAEAQRQARLKAEAHAADVEAQRQHAQQMAAEEQQRLTQLTGCQSFGGELNEQQQREQAEYLKRQSLFEEQMQGYTQFLQGQQRQQQFVPPPTYMPLLSPTFAQSQAVAYPNAQQAAYVNYQPNMDLHQMSQPVGGPLYTGGSDSPKPFAATPSAKNRRAVPQTPKPPKGPPPVLFSASFPGVGVGATSRATVDQQAAVLAQMAAQLPILQHLTAETLQDIIEKARVDGKSTLAKSKTLSWALLTYLMTADQVAGMQERGAISTRFPSKQYGDAIGSLMEPLQSVLNLCLSFYGLVDGKAVDNLKLHIEHVRGNLASRKKRNDAE